MKQRTFGRSGLRVSELVFGGGWVGGILIHPDEDTRRAALERAVAAGIDWIDTAPLYGQGESESALGRLLPGIEPRPRISTKVGIDLERLGDIAGQVERSVAASLERLGRDRVELVQLHNPLARASGGGRLAAREVLRANGVADALERLRGQGLFDLVGITALGEAGAIVEVLDSGRFDSAQVYYNLLNPSAAQPVPPGWSGHDFSGVLEACLRNGAAPMAIRVLAAGVLATDVRHGREVPVATGTEIPLEEARARAVGEALGDAHGTRARTAIRYALSNPDLACVVVGMAELGHLEEALGAAAAGPLPAATLARVRALQDADFRRPNP